MIRLVCREELEPTEESCEDFLFGINNQYDPKRYDHEKFRQMAELFENASTTLEDKTGFWAGEAGCFWKLVGEPVRALTLELRVVRLKERYQPNSENLAAVYNNMGRTYGILGDHQKALEYKLKSLGIRMQVLVADHPNLALSYNNVGYTYGDLGNYHKALEYMLKALEIRERVLPEDHLDLAQSYNNVGNIYSAQGEHQKALEYKLKSLKIKERVLGENHPSYAISCNDVGYTFGLMGDNVKGLEYCVKALVIRERMLPKNHHSIARSCNNIAWIYYSMGKLEEATSYMRRAAEIINRSNLPENHPNRVNFNKWAEEMEEEARQARGGE